MLLSLRSAQGTNEWASGVAFLYENWGEYDPDSTAGNAQDCGAVCHGGEIAGYSGEFWIDDDCSREYAFCCDEENFVLNGGTDVEDSFLYKVAMAEAEQNSPVVLDPNPYEDRRLCFSTKQTWADAQVSHNSQHNKTKHTKPTQHNTRPFVNQSEAT